MKFEPSAIDLTNPDIPLEARNKAAKDFISNEHRIHGYSPKQTYWALKNAGAKITEEALK